MIDHMIALALMPSIWPVFGFALLAGFARGLAGFGVGLVMLPVTAAALGPTVAVPLLVLIDAPTAIWLASTVWRQFDRRELAILLLAALAGIPGGIAILVIVDAEIIRVTASIVVLAFAGALIMGFRLSGTPSTTRSSITGFLAGFMEGAVSLPGPPLILGWLASQVPGARLRANTIIFFAGLMVIAIPGFGIAGLLTRDTLITAIVVFPFFLVGVISGKSAAGHVPDATFRRIVMGLVIAGAISGLFI